MCINDIDDSFVFILLYLAPQEIALNIYQNSVMYTNQIRYEVKYYIYTVTSCALFVELTWKQ